MADKTLEEVQATPGKADDFFHGLACYFRAVGDTLDEVALEVVDQTGGDFRKIPIGEINTWGPILANTIERADKATNECSGADVLKNPKNSILAAIFTFIGIDLSKYKQ